MNTAAILLEQNRLVCCVMQDSTHVRYLTARASDAARLALCAALTAAKVQEVVLVQNHQSQFDSIASLLLLHQLGVWLAKPAFIDDITGLLPRRPGTRTRAAIVARLPLCQTWLACLTALTLPPTPPAQLGLL